MQLAATLATARGNATDAAHWAGKVSAKQEEILETPLLEESKARTKLDKHMDKVGRGGGGERGRGGGGGAWEGGNPCVVVVGGGGGVWH